jgi:hypothetical protein
MQEGAKPGGKGAVMKKLVLGIAALAATGGCTAGQDTAVAEAAVARFHQMLDAQQYHEIYQGTDGAFRNVTSEAQLTGILQTVHERLGAVQEASRSGWHVNFSNGTTRVELNYNTRFASAPGTERFVYTIANGGAALVSYDVNSAALRGGATASAAPDSKPAGTASDPPAADAGPTDTGDK